MYKHIIYGNSVSAWCLCCWLLRPSFSRCLFWRFDLTFILLLVSLWKISNHFIGYKIYSLSETGLKLLLYYFFSIETSSNSQRFILMASKSFKTHYIFLCVTLNEIIIFFVYYHRKIVLNIKLGDRYKSRGWGWLCLLFYSGSPEWRCSFIQYEETVKSTVNLLITWRIYQPQKKTSFSPIDRCILYY